MIYTVGVLCSFVVYILLGLYLSRRVNTSEDYYVSGRNGSTFMVTGTLVASFLSTVSFMGEVGFSYEGYPVLLLILIIFNASGYVFGVFLFGRYLRRSQSLTVPEYFGRRFQSQKVRAAAAITTIIGISAYLIAVTQGVALILAEFIERFICHRPRYHLDGLCIVYHFIRGQRRHGQRHHHVFDFFCGHVFGISVHLSRCRRFSGSDFKSC